MQEFNLKARKRTEKGKKYNKKIRKQGYTPAIIYGDEKNIMCEIETKALKHLIYTDKVYLINLDLDGEIIKCIKKDEQFHPVTDEILHIDFLKIFDDKKVRIFLPIKLTGFAKGVKVGGHLFQLKRYMRVNAFPKDIPDQLQIDVTDLGLGKSLKIKELSFDNLEIHEPESDVVAMVKLTRAAMSKADSEGEGEGEESKEAAE
jgi:large subunit ribosomal protein L25